MLQLDHIVLARDFSPVSDQALRYAIGLAQHTGATLHLLYADVLHEDPFNAVTPGTGPSRDAQIRERLQVDADDTPLAERFADVMFETEVRRDVAAAPAILGYASDQDADLIIMGTHGRRGVRRLLMGSVAEEVVRRSGCPVLTVCGDKQPAPDRDVNRILVPLGLSDHSDALFAHARAIGATYGAHLELLHVIERSNLPQAYGLEDQAPDDEVVERRVHEAMTRYADAAREAGVDATVSVRRGHPVEIILDLLNDEPADLVTIATHGRTGIKRLLIGSVAEKVVRMAPCPVFTVKSFGKALVSSAAVREDGAGPHSE